MSIRFKILNLFLFLIGIASIGTVHAESIQNYSFYTPYKKVVIAPGETINYKVDVINNSDSEQQFKLKVTGLSKSWDYTIKSGSYKIEEIAVLPNDKKTIDLQVVVPLKINKGTHLFQITANGENVLPLAINVSKQGTYKTELTVDQPSMQGHSKSTFTYKAKLYNRTEEKVLYSLAADAPRGWDVSFKVKGKQVASVNVDKNSKQDITITVKPTSIVDAKTYKIPIIAKAGSTFAEAQLETVISGSYDLELTTPTGVLSEKITAGETKTIDLLVRNTGTSEIESIKLESTKPTGWDISFDSKEIKNLKAGKSETVKATIKVAKKAIAGDYIANFSAKAKEASDKTTIRLSVRTSMIWGWLGILIIIAALGSLIFLFRKYGRR